MFSPHALFLAAAGSALAILTLPAGSELRDHSAGGSMFEPGTFGFRLELAPHARKTLRLRAFVPKLGLPSS